MARSKPEGYYAKKFDPNSEVSKSYGGRYCVARHKELLSAPFKISAECCRIFKKDTTKRYEKTTGRKPFIGMLAQESMERRRQWITNGCNAFDKKRPTSNPLSFWKEQDVLAYAHLKGIKIASVYGDIVLENGIYKTTRLQRTGCVYCLLGIQRDKTPNRIEQLQATHPQLYNYCINGGEFNEKGQWQPTKDGLGMSYVLDYLKVKYKKDNNLFTCEQ